MAFASENKVIPILHVVSWNAMGSAYPGLEKLCAEKGGVLISKFAEESGRHSYYSYLGVVGACLVGPRQKKSVFVPVTVVTNYTESELAPSYLKKKCSDLGGVMGSETLRALMGGSTTDPYISAALCKLN